MLYKTYSLPHYVTKFKRRNEFYSANLIILLLPTVENDNSFSSSIVLPYSSTNCTYINPFILISTIHAQFHTSINHKHLFKRVYFSLHSPQRNPLLTRMRQSNFFFLWINIYDCALFYAHSICGMKLRRSSKKRSKTSCSDCHLDSRRRHWQVVVVNGLFVHDTIGGRRVLLSWSHNIACSFTTGFEFNDF